MDKLLSLILVVILVLTGCNNQPKPQKCHNDDLKYKKESMEGYESLKVESAYYEISNSHLVIYLKNYTDKSDKELSGDDLSVELHLACINTDKCPGGEFKPNTYSINSKDAVKNGLGVKAYFRTQDGRKRFYEVTTEEDKGPDRAQGHVQVESIHDGTICGRVDLIDTHGKSVKGHFTASLLSEETNEQ